MASWQARVAAFIVRRRVKPALGDMRDIGRVRKVFAAPLPVPRGVRYTDAVVGGVAGEWVEAVAAAPNADLTVLYLHGGGFVGCSPRTHRPLTAALALHGARVFVPDYRLAPEHPFPAALDDVGSCWRALSAAADAAGPRGRLVVAGDSAGGNLALALMLAVRDAGERLPDAAALFSPGVDLTGGSASLRDNSGRDAMFDGAALANLIPVYLGGADPAQPLASPLLGDLAGLPPLLVHVGADEVLRDDSQRLADKARAAGVTVELEVWPTVPHVWQLLWRLPEAKRSVQAAFRFLRDAAPATARAETAVEHRDVLIVGAGLSGIGAAAHLQDRCPAKSYAILEARDAIGGTWDLFRYPGIRSDSDMYTLGYEFKPWKEPKAIADGPSIRSYIVQTAAERGIDRHIRFGQRVVGVDWSSAEARWSVEVERGGKRQRYTCSFLLMCAGYYSYAGGYRPGFPGEASYRGVRVDPQFWPEHLDYAGKRVVVIGSGATAVTLVPEMAKAAAHVTMLQRSPTYMISLPSRDPVAGWLRGKVPAPFAYWLVRWKNVLLTMLFFNLARKWPDRTKARLVGFVRRHLGPEHDVETHFTPRYNPWTQRLCVVPDSDLFRAMRRGTASIVTDTIETFTERGIRLASGRELEADIVVTATGLKLNVLGDVAVSIDGEPCRAADTVAYKGMMFSGVPNLVSTFGYTNASWTLKADLTAGFACRLFAYMDRHGYDVAMPRHDPAVATLPFLDFSSGYVQRALDVLPKQGASKPWRLYQNYLLDLLTLRFGRIDDGTLEFRRRPAVAATGPGPAPLAATRDGHPHRAAAVHR
jgi:cation diffusion facilitator CzcD-associated flavoprotein CzcO/acetyl esterase/lipase